MFRHASLSVRPRLFVELSCGSAPVTLALLGGPDARPPCSYTGSKRGYIEPVLGAMGLAPGAGADAVLLCDPGPWSHFWRTCTAPNGVEVLAEELRAHGDADARELFVRLKREGRERDLSPAEWLVLQAWNYACKPTDRSLGFNASKAATTTHALAERVLELATLDWPTTRVITGPAEELSVEGVATWLADEAPIGAPLAGSYVYIDPPYVGTMPYGSPFPRDAVLQVARAWSDAGAVVGVSEAVPLAAELGPGWTSIDITASRRGGPRTFSRQQTEFVTVNRTRLSRRRPNVRVSAERPAAARQAVRHPTPTRAPTPRQPGR